MVPDCVTSKLTLPQQRTNHGLASGVELETRASMEKASDDVSREGARTMTSAPEPSRMRPATTIAAGYGACRVRLRPGPGRRGLSRQSLRTRRTSLVRRECRY